MTVNAAARPLATVVLAAAAITLAACGSQSQPTSRTGNTTDRAFVNGMIPHHRMAIDMATIAQNRAEHAQIRQLARAIIHGQAAEISLMNRLRGELPGGEGSTLRMSPGAMGMHGDPMQLKAARPFDRTFIDMMVPHHAGAIAMARIELARGRSPSVRAVARRIIAAQSAEIADMRRWRSAWYGSAGSSGAMMPGAHGRGDHMSGGHQGQGGMAGD